MLAAQALLAAQGTPDQVGQVALALPPARLVSAVTALNGTPRMAAAAAAVAAACVRPPLLTAETAVTMAAGVERRIQQAVIP